MPPSPLLAAVRFAAEKHRGQRRKGSTAVPYINHPIAVAEILNRVGGIDDPVVLMAAILHDTIEDTDTTPNEIEKHFGAAVCAIVQEVTMDMSLPRSERKQWQVDHAPHLSHNAKLVKLGDKICNVLDVTNDPPTNWSADQRIEYLDWSARVIAGCRGTNAALEQHFDEVLVRGKTVIGA